MNMKKKMPKGKMKPGAFLRSIDAALNGSFNVDAAVARTVRMAANLPQVKLFHVKRNKQVTFYKKINGIQKYVAKSSDEIYLLARRQYLLLLIEILKLTGRLDKGSIMKRNQLIESLHSLIEVYAAGNLDLARIVMTPKQYKWYTGEYKQKPFDVEKALAENPSSVHFSTEGIPLKSKSERDIMNSLHDYAVPAHYEEERSIMVQPLVDRLYHDLRENNLLKGNLYYLRGPACYWRVPKELEWMNSPGSIWKAYNPRTGRLYIYNDFKIILASGEEIIWEHHGKCFEFTYRSNAGERVMVLKFTRSVSRRNMIETFEHDVDSREKIAEILRDEVLPRLWF